MKLTYLIIKKITFFTIFCLTLSEFVFWSTGWIVYTAKHFPISAAEITFSISRRSVEIKNLTLRHLPSLPDGTHLEIPSLHLEPDLVSLLNGKPRFKKSDIHISELRFREAGKNPGHPGTILWSFPYAMAADLVNVKLDRIVFEERNEIGKMEIREIEVGLDKTYTGISDISKLVGEIERKAKRKVLGDTVKNLDPLGVYEVVETTLHSSKWLARQIVTFGLLA